jgi:septal ring factor EnvC (AmiA/AmiB activator)
MLLFGIKLSWCTSFQGYKRTKNTSYFEFYFKSSLLKDRFPQCINSMPSVNSRIRLISILIILLTSGISYAQKSKKQLEKEKKENLRKIEQTNEILKEVKKEKKASLSQLKVLKQQTRLKEKTISTIQEELGFLQGDIEHLQSEEEQMAFTLFRIKKEYASMVYAASKASVSNQLIFLFASETFNQFFMRIQYLRYYADARRKQADQINIVSLTLNQKKLKLAEVKAGKENLLVNEETEKKQLESLREDQKKVVNELSERENDLKEKIDKHKSALNRLERMISDLVKAEIKRSRTTAGPPDPKENNDSPEPGMSLTPEGKMISKSFKGNKNRLAWPVQNGFISSGFGKHEHPVLKRVYIDNLGIDISTRSGEKVRSVFEGTVGLVGSVPGMDGQIVMIRHGEYFTVYSGLKNIVVSAGDKVRIKQVLGEVIKDDEDGAILQFQIWKNNKRMDPEEWLAND